MGDILIGRRLHGAERSGVFAAIGYGGHAASIATTDDCLIAPDGGCVPWFPNFGGPSIMAGWESQSTRLRVLGGLAYLESDFGDATVGIVTRGDAVLGSISHIAAMITINGLLVPSSNGDRFGFLGIGLGLRIR